MKNVELYASLAVFVLVTCTFLVAYRLKKNDLADVIWGPGFLVATLAGWWASLFEHRADYRFFLSFALLAIWATRLTWHIGARNLTGGEDARYSQWRREWGHTWVWRSYLQVFLLQGALLLLINLPLLWIVGHPARELDNLSWLGFLLWLAGFLFEALGDEQLRRFKQVAANKGKLMTSGLWSWTRHPNYFGEVLQWWGITIFALPLPQGWITLLSPLLITFLIVKVSGIPMLEKLMEGRPGFEQYRRQTSAFIPWPKRLH